MRKCQLAGHKEKVQRPRMYCSVFNLQRKPLGSANMVAKREEKKKEKREKGKDDRTLIRSNL
jgi:hypothetical protein